MNTPDWRERLFRGAVIDCADYGILGLRRGGGMTAGDARNSADAMAHAHVLPAMGPKHLESSRNGPARAPHLAATHATSVWPRRIAVIDTNRAQRPSSDTPHQHFAHACVDGLHLDAP